MSVRIIVGDARDKLAELPDESVHCVVTSPPYYGLRDYGVAGQIGLEASPVEYVETMVAVFREVRRVLRSDGTCWLNLGDSYAGSGKGGNPEAGKQATNRGSQTVGVLYGIGDIARQAAVTNVTRGPVGGCKPKDLIGIPWLVAFALRADGWWLRQDIIWSKPNPMPESVTDRCTKAHEYLFLLSKSERYYFDRGAIAEPASYDPNDTKFPDGWDTGPGGHGAFHRQGRERGRKSGNKSHKFTAAYETSDSEEHRTKAGLLKISETAYSTRNKRDVWEVPSAPFPEAHFATFPPALIEPCILAGCPKDCCSECGAPWVRETEVGAPVGRRDNGAGDHFIDLGMSTGRAGSRERRTRGWRPTCACSAGVSRGTVLDPFGGAGTTGLVADRLGRDAVLIELSPAYAEMARRRIAKDAGPLMAAISLEAAD